MTTTETQLLQTTLQALEVANRLLRNHAARIRRLESLIQEAGGKA